MQDPRNEGGSLHLDLRQNFLADGALAASYEKLVADVFGASPARSARSDPHWDVLAFFGADGSCLAGIELGNLPLLLDGVAGAATAIRLACVASAHRGHGLFRKLMQAALQRCDERKAPTLLYTEDEALYTRFGFTPLAQHAFVGLPPRAASHETARSLDRTEADALIDRLAPSRAPVSQQCAVRGAGDLLKGNLDDEELQFAVLERQEALLVYERDAEELVIVDILAATIPTMAEIVGALGAPARRIRTLFPPDRLGWDAAPERDDTGLMIRGAVPAAMRRPFMLPPTTSF